MPSILLGAPGVVQIYSGNFFSGSNPKPVGGVQLRYSKQASGLCYVGLSGGLTINSGLFAGSGISSGLIDGVELGPGDAYWIPKEAINASGNLNIYVGTSDAATSGQARLFLEIF